MVAQICSNNVCYRITIGIRWCGRIGFYYFDIDGGVWFLYSYLPRYSSSGHGLFFDERCIQPLS